MKIIVLPSFYPTDLHPLRGSFFREQSIAISKRVNSLSIIFPELRSIRDITLSNILDYRFQYTSSEDEGIITYRKHRINFFKTKFDLGLGQRLWIEACYQMCVNYIKSHGKPDLIHAHCALGAGAAAMKIKEKYNIPYVLTEHSTGYAKGIYKKELKNNIRNIFLNADQAIAVSSPFKKLLEVQLDLPPKTIKVIPNFIDTDFFIPSYKKKRSSFKFLIVCHLVSKKRVDRVIDAFSKLIDEFPQIELKIAGMGDQFDSLRNRVCQLRLENKILFHGQASREDVRNLMQESDCFVLSSDIETFGVVLIEALSCGIPVIATRSGGPEDIVNKVTGTLVNRTVEELANAMKNIIINIEIYSASKLRNEVLDKYSSESISQRYVDLYSKILSLYQ
ncbi:glycosyltransferase [uncultured Arcticibacterium sp.]|uniref:glycosyltransferase n=1 Tax=uncultured Arcticibacterium sp. TaxID=2173042 RepID=UPI0030FC2F3F